MSYCLNPNCPKPLNPEKGRFCIHCGSKLLLGSRYRPLRAIAVYGTGATASSAQTAGNSNANLTGRTFLAIDEGEINQPHCIIKQIALDRRTNPANFRDTALKLQQVGQHPQIPALLAYFEPDPHSNAPAFLVQEFIAGQSLRAKLATEGAFNETQIRQLLNEILPVLQYVHESGVIHRDINPDNLIQPPGNYQLMLVDFSAAKATSKTNLAQKGTLIGSVSFAAPEQLRGQAVYASDVYSLAVVCVYLLTQIEPFDLFSSQVGILVWQDYLLTPVSQELSRIINKMLADSVPNRYQSAAAVFRDLNSGQTLTKSAVKLVTKALIPTWKCRQTLLGHHSSVHTLSFSYDGKLLASGGADRNVKVWNLKSGREQATFSGHRSIIEAVIFTPDSKRIISGSWDYKLKFWQFGNSEELQTIQAHFGWIKALALSHDGQILASASSDRSVKVWDLHKNALWLTFSELESEIYSLAINREKSLLVGGDKAGKIIIWDLDKGQKKCQFEGHQDSVTAINFSPSGKFLFSASADKTIEIWDLNNGSIRHNLEAHSEAINALAVNREGNLLISGSDDKTIKIWHPVSGDLLATLAGHSAPVKAVAISFDSAAIASASQDKTIKLWQFQ
ncbi:MAG: serine/threonine-protein kinase [Oscillatoria sp. PMC 1068.18]|nr:serine/threonine-protein kinase [Oscillatoria sp. PMC 1076.18]MEC4989879.1 serine/threonine-protein kinase [Oscillatoria sp. PMC 1068.18]